MENLSSDIVKRGTMYDLLADPLNDRQVKDLPLPPCQPIQDSVLYKQGNDIPNWKILK